MSRHSTIRQVPNMTESNRGPDSVFVVDLYEDNVLLESRQLPGKNRYYAEDVSQNWDNGIIKLESK